jgi:ribosome-associated protein YbcJ (S4-like RNA binding protein)
MKQVIEGKINGQVEVTRRRKKLLDDFWDRS